jgi:myo-inositol-1(or 4)-monophosphatase
MDPAAARALAEDVAREAGAGLRAAFGRGVAVRAKSSATDLVSEADLDAERVIRDRIGSRRPHDAVLGEEGGDTAGTSGVRWIVDPLDGTTNFLFGVPLWTVSVACEDAGGPLAGAVFDPSAGELWSAQRDGPALRNGEPLPPRPARSLADALVATGFGYDAGVRASQGATLARLLPHVRDVRRLGSCAQDLAWTAAGRYDAYFERGPQRWDVAAGELICARAGLERHALPPAPPAPAGLLVAPPALADPLLALLA